MMGFVLLIFSEHLGSPTVYDGVRVAHLLSFLCYVFRFACLCPVSCMPNFTSFSGLSLSCILCDQCYHYLWIVFVLCLVCPMLPVSLDCLCPVCPMLPVSLDCLSLSCVLYTQCCQFLWIVFVLCLEYPMLSVSQCLWIVMRALCCQCLWIVMRALCCQCLWIVHYWLPLWFSLMFILIKPPSKYL